MKKLTSLAAAIILATATCILLGFNFQVPDDEKQQGLTGIYDVADNGAIGFVTYEKGKPTIYVKNGDLKQASQLPSDRKITDLVIMPGGRTIYYVSSDKQWSSTVKSEVHKVDPDAGTDDVLFSEDAIITELALDPSEHNELYYLQADVFENYSPIAAEQPHEFDIHHYDIGQQVRKKLTDFKKYNMASLQVSHNENSVYVQMDDDSDAETADEVSGSKQRIFRIPLEHPDQPKLLFMPMQLEDIYDFTLIPDRETVVYQAVGGTGEDGIYEYELFTYNWKTMKNEQLTFQKEHAARPVYGADGKLYYMTDYNFADRKPDYSLFRIDFDGGNMEEVPLLD